MTQYYRISGAVVAKEGDIADEEMVQLFDDIIDLMEKRNWETTLGFKKVIDTET